MPRVRQPKRFEIDDSMFIFPDAEASASVEVVRGPSIGEVPRNDPLPEVLEGQAVIKVGDKVTTDHIMPAGPRLKHRSNVEVYSQFVFENVDAEFAQRAAANRAQREREQAEKAKEQARADREALRAQKHADREARRKSN